MQSQKNSLVIIEEHAENIDTKDIMDQKNRHLNVVTVSAKNQANKPIISGAACSSSTCCCSSC